MLLGADISHPNVLTKVKRSITGMCGSMDLSATTYIGRSSVQKETHNPTIEVLEELVSELLFNYKERNRFESKTQLSFIRGVYFKNWKKFFSIKGIIFIFYNISKYFFGALGFLKAKIRK